MERKAKLSVIAMTSTRTLNKQKKLDIVSEIYKGMFYIIKMNENQLESIPMKILQDCRNIIQKIVLASNKSDKYVSEMYISENGHDDAPKT